MKVIVARSAAEARGIRKALKATGQLKRFKFKATSKKKRRNPKKARRRRKTSRARRRSRK